MLLLVVGVAVAAEVGTRWYLADEVEQRASERIEAPVEVDFPLVPILPGIVLDRSVDTVTLTSPGTGTSPRIDVTGHGVTMVDDVVRADTASGTVTLTGPQLATLATQNSPVGGGPLDQLSEIRSVTPDVQAGVLRADVGGIAEISVRPGVTDGRLTLTPQQTSLLGFSLPDGLFSGITGTVDSTVAALPDGVRIDDAVVVEQGLEVHLSGTDVTLQ